MECIQYRASSNKLESESLLESIYSASKASKDLAKQATSITVNKRMGCPLAGSERIRTSDTRDLGINFWRAELSDDQVAIVRKFHEVSGVMRDDVPGADPFD
ncbi:hypothetical protein CIHG_07133 [Coccidioides immitis H538.4]|uniref:Uncharacterized protein n=1 Tax=Coccidioides immitis H538.4 TaxID=396776 RepID=A0A0J8RYE3_COCIT|nr:hypothetical protein CIHG_07133 [Coccidioides immitis H538.4]